MGFAKRELERHDLLQQIATKLLLASGELEEHECGDNIDLGGGSDQAYQDGAAQIASGEEEMAPFDGDVAALRQALDDVLRDASSDGDCRCARSMAKDG